MVATIASARAEREPSRSPNDNQMRVIEMKNAAIGVERRRDHALAAERGVAAEPRRQEIHVRHAVEKRQYRRIAPTAGANKFGGGGEVVGLAAQKNEVKRIAQIAGRDGRRVR